MTLMLKDIFPVKLIFRPTDTFTEIARGRTGWAWPLGIYAAAAIASAALLAAAPPEFLAKAAGGSYISISLNSDKRINPFDLPKLGPNAEGEKVLRSAIVTLLGLMNLLVGTLTPEEDALMDKAIRETYALKDITDDVKTHANPMPTMEDLQNVLDNMQGAESLSQRLSKYTRGTFAGIFNQPTNFELDTGLMVFNIRALGSGLLTISFI